MQTITFSEFKALVNNGLWEHNCGLTDVGSHIDGSKITYQGYGQAINFFGDLEIKWTECFSYVGGEAGSFSANTEHMDKPLEMNFRVVLDGDDSEPVDDYDLSLALPKALREIDYSDYNDYR